MGGVFSALSARSAEPQSKYELAGKMKDLSLGDAHIFPIDDLMNRSMGKDLVKNQNDNIATSMTVEYFFFLPVIYSLHLLWLKQGTPVVDFQPLNCLLSAQDFSV